MKLMEEKDMRKLKRYIVMITLLLGLLVPSMTKAQMYLSEDVEEYDNPRLMTQEWNGLAIPLEGSDDDQFTPLGGGTIILTALGAYYLLKKRRKEDSNG